MTYPLLFIMLSNHFPSTFGHAWNWVVLLVLTIGSAAIRHFMNMRFTMRRWLFPTTLTFFAACTALVFLFAHPRGLHFGGANAATSARRVGFAEAHGIIEKRCVTCHSSH